MATRLSSFHILNYSPSIYMLVSFFFKSSHILFVRPTFLFGPPQGVVAIRCCYSSEAHNQCMSTFFFVLLHRSCVLQWLSECHCLKFPLWIFTLLFHYNYCSFPRSELRRRGGEWATSLGQVWVGAGEEDINGGRAGDESDGGEVNTHGQCSGQGRWPPEDAGAELSLWIWQWWWRWWWEHMTCG